MSALDFPPPLADVPSLQAEQLLRARQVAYCLYGVLDDMLRPLEERGAHQHAPEAEEAVRLAAAALARDTGAAYRLMIPDHAAGVPLANAAVGALRAEGIGLSGPRDAACALRPGEERDDATVEIPDDSRRQAPHSVPAGARTMADDSALNPLADMELKPLPGSSAPRAQPRKQSAAPQALPQADASGIVRLGDSQHPTRTCVRRAAASFAVCGALAA